jgi:hypothetical protein
MQSVHSGKSGKLLGFVVSDKGIKVDPNEVKAIQTMPTPKTKKDVRIFLNSWITLLGLYPN